MRLFLASLIFLAALLDMNFGAGTVALEVAAFVAALLLVLSVIADFLWLDPPPRRSREEEAADTRRPAPP